MMLMLNSTKLIAAATVGATPWLPFLLRYYNHPLPACSRSLWVSYGDGMSMETPVTGINNIYGLQKFIKRELSPDLDPVPLRNLAIFLPGSKKSLQPVVLLADLHKHASSAGFDPHDPTTPLILKLLTKKIFIQDLDEDLRPLRTFSPVVIRCSMDIKVKAAGSGASAISRIGGDRGIASEYEEVIDGEYYRVHSPYALAHHREARWQQKEDKAMEDEVARAIKHFLTREFGKEKEVQQLQSVLLGEDGQAVQEWDAIFRVGDAVFLCEAKHSMDALKIQQVSERVQGFRDLVREKVRDKSVVEGVHVIVGVVCAVHFPPEIRKKAKEEKLWCVWPSGMRYIVEGGGPLSG